MYQSFKLMIKRKINQLNCLNKKPNIYTPFIRLSVYNNVNDLILYLKNKMKNKQKTIEGNNVLNTQVRRYLRNLKQGDNLVQEHLDKFISSSIKIINKNNMLSNVNQCPLNILSLCSRPNSTSISIPMERSKAIPKYQFCYQGLCSWFRGWL